MAQSQRFDQTPRPPSPTELFHRLNSVVPERQEVLAVAPDLAVSDALDLMSRHGFSQLPVKHGTEVLGVFSYRSFALRAQTIEGTGVSLAETPVSEFLESLVIARATDELVSVFDALDADNAILIGQPEELQAIVTPMDVLRYLHGLAESFVQLSEIEQALRSLSRRALQNDGFRECAARTMAGRFREDQIPEEPENTTFGQLVRIMLDEANWPQFSSGFGGARRELVTLRLKPLPDLRNDVFHFRRELTTDERRKLGAERDWLLLQLRMRDAQDEG